MKRLFLMISEKCSSKYIALVFIFCTSDLKRITRVTKVNPCSITIYAEQGVNISVEIEATCDRLYTCSHTNMIKRIQGANLMPFKNCFLIENKGSIARVSIIFPRMERIIPDNPIKGNLLHPYPPYTLSDILIVFDTSPRYDLYGLEARGATVIASKKRIVLEGKGIVQLVDASQGVIIDDIEIIVDDILAFESLYPILPRDRHSRGIRLCSTELGITEERLHYDHGNPTCILGYVNYIRKTFNKMGQLQLQAALTRIYSLTPIDATKIFTLAEKLSTIPRIEAVVKQGNMLKLVSELERLPLRLRRKERNKTIITEILLDNEVLVDDWHEISIFCRECWEPLSLYELRNHIR